MMVGDKFGFIKATIDFPYKEMICPLMLHSILKEVFGMSN